MLAGVPLLPLPPVLPGLLSGFLDKFLQECLAPVLPVERLQELRLLKAPVVRGLYLRCRRFLCHGLVSAIACLTSPWSILGSGPI